MHNLKDSTREVKEGWWIPRYIQKYRSEGAQELVAAHDMASRYFVGRMTEIVYDQDRVMAVLENAGDLMLTQVLETYARYAGFTVCL